MIIEKIIDLYIFIGIIILILIGSNHIYLRKI